MSTARNFEWARLLRNLADNRRRAPLRQVTDADPDRLVSGSGENLIFAGPGTRPPGHRARSAGRQVLWVRCRPSLTPVAATVSVQDVGTGLSVPEDLAYLEFQADQFQVCANGAPPCPMIIQVGRTLG